MQPSNAQPDREHGSTHARSATHVWEAVNTMKCVLHFANTLVLRGPNQHSWAESQATGMAKSIRSVQLLTIALHSTSLNEALRGTAAASLSQLLLVLPLLQLPLQYCWEVLRLGSNWPTKVAEPL